MERRTFLTGTAAGAAAATASAFPRPAISQGLMEWTMVTSWPRNLPGPGTAANMLAERITALSGGRLTVTVSAAGELVPPQGVFDAVGEGTAQMYHSVPAYWRSKSVGILFFGSMPFGLTAPEQSGWLNHGGGQDLYEEMYARFNLKAFLCGNSGPQWFGWFRNEINTLDDLRGLRFRTAGHNQEMLSRVGVAVVNLPGGEIFQALQSGTIDAAEFIGPWSDSALGFHQVASNYYWPGIGEPSSAEECGINLEAYESLPDDLKQAVRYACQSLYDEVLTDYNSRHPVALRQLVEEHGVQVREVPEPVLIALGNAAGEIVTELRENDDELIRRITESFLTYRAHTVEYMTYADNGIMNARRLPYSYGG